MFTKLIEYFKSHKEKSKKKKESSSVIKKIITPHNKSVTQIPISGLSVTQRVKNVNQPVGGYLNFKKFDTININSDDFLSPECKNENLNPRIIELAVDYLTRTLLTNKPLEAFSVSIKGAKLIGEFSKSQKKAESIVDLSPESIISACQMSGYDVCVCKGASYYKPVQEIFPNNTTIANIELMVKRSLKFFKEYGPVVECGFSVGGEGCAKHVVTGNGDFLTSDTIWDFKASNKKPTSEHTLQLLMYYLMGKRSTNKNLHNIQNLGTFNPRLNKIYILKVSDIPAETIEIVEKEVIGY